MIAKLIVWDRDRTQALSRMRQALAQYRVVGVANNVEFLSRLVASPAFANADLDTGLIEREQAVLFPAPGEVPEAVWHLAALAELLREQQAAETSTLALPALERHSPWRSPDGWRLNSPARRTLVLRFGEHPQAVGVTVLNDGYRLSLGTQHVLARGSLDSDGQLRAQLGERRLRATVVLSGERCHVFFEGRAWPLSRVAPLDTGTSGPGEGSEGGLKAPMPGKVIALLVPPGSPVEKGTPLLVLEAMKMEHTISAPCQGVVQSFRYAAGEQVSDGSELVEFEATASPKVTS